MGNNRKKTKRRNKGKVSNSGYKDDSGKVINNSDYNSQENYEKVFKRTMMINSACTKLSDEELDEVIKTKKLPILEMIYDENDVPVEGETIIKDMGNIDITRIKKYIEMRKLNEEAKELESE